MSGAQTCPCPCGLDLVDGKVDPPMVMAGVSCDYRTCPGCGSTRAFMPPDLLEGHPVRRYDDPATSEIGGEWGTLLDALEQPPPGEASLVMRNGHILAYPTLLPDDLGDGVILGWQVMAPRRA